MKSGAMYSNLPYGGKFWREKTFGKFGDLLWIRQSFIRQLLVIPEKARGRAKIRQIFLCQMQFSLLFATRQNFLLYGINLPGKKFWNRDTFNQCKILF